ncbi:hypothetical protein QBC46DRAFT_272703, partial [Diplogelasinospora grovesii]
EAVKIIGEEEVDGETHYMFVWAPSLGPKRYAKNAAKLIKKWEVKKARITR